MSAKDSANAVIKAVGIEDIQTVLDEIEDCMSRMQTLVERLGECEIILEVVPAQSE